MSENTFTDRNEFLRLYGRLYSFFRQEWDLRRVSGLKELLRRSFKKAEEQPDSETLYHLVSAMRTAVIIIDEIGLKQPAVCAVLLFHSVVAGDHSPDEIERLFGSEVESILRGLKKVNQFSDKRTAVESENYIKLLLSIAEDIRVVFIMIAQQLQRMRDAKGRAPSHKLDLAVESTYLYAPLAHRLGLYTIKSELEDLSLKYTDREQYDFIARKLNETKRSRDRYISEFIGPVKERLDKTGLKYDIKGRTKSIYSIQNKLKKQKIEFENIYDLFAIRVILDSPPEQEKAQCWQVYSIITDMYQPNPKRLKDWLSIPKSNGYESLHITVMGPDGRWVEVQIRSKRMDEIAERGLAAHWKYKGVKGETVLDNWLSSLRESLEDSETNLSQKLTDFKLDLYDEEIFVFTPKGDLFKLPKGATVLDFAFAIHSNLGATCMSGRVNGKNVPIRHVLKSGDQVAVNTSSHQTPKQDWLSFAVTSKARTKIRQLLKEEAGKQVDIAKETLLRRMRNRKIEVDEPRLMQLIKKLRYKTVTEFYVDIASEKIDVNWVIDRYLELESKESEGRESHATMSAEEFTLKTPSPEITGSDELIIDQNLTGVDYKLAKCCNPIFGDDIFGFVSSQGIKIHRANCPNAHDLFSRFGYRILKARWSGKTSSSSYTIVLRVIGNDQLNIVANLMSIISKEEGVQMRSITIDSNDGLFQGNIAVMLGDTSMLDQLIKKLRAVKGVKSVSRLN
ncbi:RelA/SpoT family protein [Proteiniphilum acetatigenes]|uniref:RelA/SpoT family protein n=1 Tax=Proteiniphilum acetatigenes TaxID=294710 RepID=UPI0003755AE9|nr:HD domain-containing protein [Proteiniphilum acetatigenes]SFK46153.1 GTP pyrophosphokinase [Porphyromonadaceae bacterium KH3CP3RA]